MHAFDYQAPSTLEDAIELLAKSNGTGRPLAGGTDVIDQIRIGRLSPEVLIDVKNISELTNLSADDKGLTVGAAVPCYQICGNETVLSQYSALADSCQVIGSVQIQSRATVGGNLCNSGPAADSIPSMIALSGRCLIAGPSGTREVPVESFCTGPSENILQPGELLVDVHFPTRPANSGSHYRRMIPRNEMDIAVVGVGASVVLDESGQNFVSARIGLAAVGPTPLYAEAAGNLLAGQPINEESIAKAAAAAQEIASPITDMRGTREYRLHVTGVLTRRVLEAAVTRARGEALNYCPGR